MSIDGGSGINSEQSGSRWSKLFRRDRNQPNKDQDHQDPQLASRKDIETQRKAVERAAQAGIQYVTLQPSSMTVELDQKMESGEIKRVTLKPSVSRDGSISGIDINGKIVRRDNRPASEDGAVKEGNFRVLTDEAGKTSTLDYGVKGQDAEGKIGTFASEMEFNDLIDPIRLGMDVIRAKQDVRVIRKGKWEPRRDGSDLLSTDSIPILNTNPPTPGDVQYRHRNLGGFNFHEYGQPIGSKDDRLKHLIDNGRKDLAIPDRQIFDSMYSTIKSPLQARPSGMAPRPPGPRIQ